MAYRLDAQPRAHDRRQFPVQEPQAALAPRRGLVLGHAGGCRPRQQHHGLAVGGLAAPMYFAEERTIGPSLGADNITKGIDASLWGMLFVSLKAGFMMLLLACLPPSLYWFSTSTMALYSCT